MKTSAEAMEILEKSGFDIGQAMEICADDTDLYMEVLKTALEEGKRKFAVIENSIHNEDYERYHIEVHALKNAAKAIGAMKLSELAGVQELAARQGGSDGIAAGGAVLLENYSLVLEILKSVFD